jgi:hypothetical protein
MRRGQRLIRAGLGGLVLALVLAASACSGSGASHPSPAPSVSTNLQAAYPGTDQGAMDLMGRLGATGDLPLLLSMKPTTADYQALFEPVFAERAERFYESWLWASPSGKPFADPDQTEVRVWGAKTEDIRRWTPAVRYNFPGGYKEIKDYLKPGFVMYSIDLVRPGEDLGMGLNGLTYINGHWVLFLKPWYVLEGLAQHPPLSL